MAIDYTKRPTAKPAEQQPGVNYTKRRDPAPPPADRTAAPRIARRPSAAPNTAHPNRPATPAARPPAPAASAPSGVQSRPAARPPATPGLVSAAQHLTQINRDWQQVADQVAAAANDIAGHFVGAHRDLTAALRQLAGTKEQLSQAFHDRFGESAYGSSSGASPAGPDAWIASAQDAISRVRTANVPWTDKARKQLRQDFQQLVSSLLSSYDPTVRQYCEDEWQSMCHYGAAHANDLRAAYLRNARPVTPPPPPIGPHTRPLDPSHDAFTGPGPLNIYLGNLRAQSLHFTSTAHGDYQSTDHHLALPELEIPVVVDLDTIGALLIDEPRCIEGAVLNLLSALPAHQLQLRIFDPEHGGNSAKFLFGLGDSADRIIGDRVKTSDRELDDLLQSTEEHITFVTQRFLQGEHKSLTEYNRAAGEVAEAYRLLVLYGFPSGFSRGGHFDQDQLDRLNKIIRNGPRTGVFTILVCHDHASLTPDQPRTTTTPSGLYIPNQHQDPSREDPLAHVKRLVAPLPWFVVNGSMPDHTLEQMASWPNGVQLARGVPTRVGAGTTARLSEGLLTWQFIGAPPPSQPVAASQLDAVKRNMHTAEDVKVTPQRVAQLAEQAQHAASATLNATLAPTVAHPDRPETWWRATSERGVIAHFGRIGARQVADLIVDSEVATYGALIGGRPGSGKSVLIHAVIMSMVTEYSPSEVELFLIDFKEGVEFKQYADIGLPHARVIAIESERDFGLSVLQRARDEIKRRGELFRDAGRGAVKLEEYRDRTGQPMKRLILIIDEFQQLFYRDDKIAGDCAEILELILRQGRAFGIHVVLASQSLAGMASLGKHVLGLIPTRIALQSTESDSRMILNEENTDAQTLVRAGEGILNRKGGHKDANERFQTAFWDPDDRAKVLTNLAHRAHAERHPHITTVFAGHKPADITEVDPAALTPTAETGLGIGIPAGLPLTLDSLPLFAQLRRDAGGNLLLVDEHGEGMLAAAITSLHRQGVHVDVVDFVGEEANQWADMVTYFEGLQGVSIHRRRGGMREALSELVQQVDQRQEFNDFKSPARVLVFAAMGRARDLDPNDSFDDDAPSNQLGRILRDGPEVGIHVVSWFDRPAGIDKRLDRQQLSEFAQRLVGPLSRDDSNTLIDSDNAAGLKPGQGILADLDRITEHKIRKFDVPSTDCLTAFTGPVR